MKVIDLLNKIAKGEEVPKKIKWNYDEYSYVNDSCKNYANDYEDFMSVVDGACLNDEIEIIEEKTPKEKFIEERMKIDKITREEFDKTYNVVECNCGAPFCKGFRAIEIIEEAKEIEELEKTCVFHQEPLKPPFTKMEYEQSKEEICDKINELVREINELKKNKE